MKKTALIAGVVVLAFSLFGAPVSATGSWDHGRSHGHKHGYSRDHNRDGYTEWDGRDLKKGKTEGNAYIDSLRRTNITLRGDSGLWTSPVVATKKPFESINPSWQADAPAGSSVAIELRVRGDNQWSDWYKLGDWARDNSDSFKRTSTNDQSDTFGSVYTDTYVNTTDKKVNAYQVRVKLSGNDATKPRVYQVAAQTASAKTFEKVSRTDLKKTIDLQVPAFSQYTHEGEYPEFGGGGEAWCSPTSVAMVLKYYGTGPSQQDIDALPADVKFDANGRKDGEVPYAALHTYDQAYEGTGNWAFNTTYAASYGLDSAVRVFDSLRDVEKEIKEGNPVVASIAWNNTDDKQDNDLPNAGVDKTAGHLMVIRGFTKEGDVIANDPATHNGNGDVRRVYDRTSFERQWINSSNATAYTFDRKNHK